MSLLLSIPQSLFIVPKSACHVNFDGVLEEGDGPSASEDSLAFSEDSLSSSSSFLHFRSSQVLSARLLFAHPNLRPILSLHPFRLTTIVIIVTTSHCFSEKKEKNPFIKVALVKHSVNQGFYLSQIFENDSFVPKKGLFRCPKTIQEEFFVNFLTTDMLPQKLHVTGVLLLRSDKSPRK